ncbi:DUF2007 domain-containing protein [Isachenkonia alkalipeptolytica]|uniref:DUF2007 domain-containing protein n=1 Tax=Isachenkonia alkalipeptolytica TaxID=2565777 RepID=A0AA43XKM8_9CLOT|nr:DUF2007 domain-containing protein [Isachenkonia alkalipeptolytica]NBG88024.1 DUF2007 domain-containing protein [Isachenkonia alkalipeptolytica]
MEFTALQLLLILAGILIFLTVFIGDKAKWREFYGGSQRNFTEVQGVFQYLRDQGIRCRLKTRIQGFSRMQNAQMTTAVVEVHKEDVERARQLMREYNNRNRRK